MRLPARQRSHALLIGTSGYRSAAFAPLPAVGNNLTALAEALCHPRLGGFSPDRCTRMSDPGDVHQLYLLMQRLARESEDTILVYFAGHGRLGPRNELFLTLTGTDPDALRTSALGYDSVREAFAQSPATNKVVILDCCLSGIVLPDMGSLDDQLVVEGTYTLTAARQFDPAIAPAGAEFTAFTGELIRLLRDGVPGGPELLSLADLYRHLLRATNRLGLPQPGRGNTGTADRLALTRNPAWVPPPMFPRVEPARPQPLPVPAGKPQLSIPDLLYQAMVGQLRRDHPVESFGLLTAPKATRHLTRLVPLPRSSEMVRQVISDVRERGEEPLVLYSPTPFPPAFAGVRPPPYLAVVSIESPTANSFRCCRIGDHLTEVGWR